MSQTKSYIIYNMDYNSYVHELFLHECIHTYSENTVPRFE